tara:strand:+ start:306 stop:605 length:300 start_codon:yes stop_codon:yes gene_type:complete
MENQIKFNLNEMGSSDIKSMHLVIDAWKDLDFKSKDIMYEGTGFNTMSGYVYIALENGISICSCFGQEVEYLVTDYDTGEEYFYETFDEALNKIEKIYL